MLNDLVIYQRVYDLLLYILPILQRMPKAYRFTVVMQIENSLLEVVTLIARANRELNKGTTLFLLDIELDKARLLFRLAHDLRLLPTDKYGQVSERLVEIGKLLGGWQRSLSLTVKQGVV